LRETPVADLIRQRPGFKVLVASSNATDAVGKVREGKARAVLLDSRLYDHDSLRLMSLYVTSSLKHGSL